MGDIQLENQRVVAGEPVADLRVRSSALNCCTIAGDLIPRLIDEIRFWQWQRFLPEGRL